MNKQLFLFLLLTVLLFTVAQVKSIGLIPVGIQHSHVIGDERLKVSSSFDQYHTATHGRLHYNSSYARAWCVWKQYDQIPDALNHWIQVTLPSVTTITGVATQGRGDEETDQRVTKYELLYNVNESETEFIRYPTVLSGNFDRNTVIINPVTPFKAKVVRLRPLEWVDNICMRWELYTTLN